MRYIHFVVQILYFQRAVFSFENSTSFNLRDHFKPWTKHANKSIVWESILKQFYWNDTGMVNIQVKSSMPAFYIGKKRIKKLTNSVLAPIISLTQVWETEKQHIGNRFLALLNSCKISASKWMQVLHTVPHQRDIFGIFQFVLVPCSLDKEIIQSVSTELA